jgi:hypothetical protein
MRMWQIHPHAGEGSKREDDASAAGMATVFIQRGSGRTAACSPSGRCDQDRGRHDRRPSRDLNSGPGEPRLSSAADSSYAGRTGLGSAWSVWLQERVRASTFAGKADDGPSRGRTAGMRFRARPVDRVDGHRAERRYITRAPRSVPHQSLEPQFFGERRWTSISGKSVGRPCATRVEAAFSGVRWWLPPRGTRSSSSPTGCARRHGADAARLMTSVSPSTGRPATT